MVHQYKLNGFNIVLDTCSGAVHVVDEVAYDIIAMIKQKTIDEIVATICEICRQRRCYRRGAPSLYRRCGNTDPRKTALYRRYI